MYKKENDNPKTAEAIAEFCGLGDDDEITVIKFHDKLKVTATHPTTRRRSFMHRLNKDTIVDKRTGETKKVKHREFRSEDSASLSRSISAILNIGLYNFRYEEGDKEDKTNMLFLTLTYANSVFDSSRLGADFTNFIKRFKRKFTEKFEYLYVIEPHKSGAWHIHALLFLEEMKVARKTPNYSPIIESAWGLGIADGELAESGWHGKNLIYYLIKDIQSAEKIYHAGVKIYRTSERLPKPKKETITVGEFKKLVQETKANDSWVGEVGNKDFKLSVVKATFNLPNEPAPQAESNSEKVAPPTAKMPDAPSEPVATKSDSLDIHSDSDCRITAPVSTKSDSILRLPRIRDFVKVLGNAKRAFKSLINCFRFGGFADSS
jgi:hypothetical protein